MATLYLVGWRRALDRRGLAVPSTTALEMMQLAFVAALIMKLKAEKPQDGRETETCSALVRSTRSNSVRHTQA